MRVQGRRPSLGAWEILPSGATEVNLFGGRHQVRSGPGRRVEERWTDWHVMAAFLGLGDVSF